MRAPADCGAFQKHRAFLAKLPPVQDVLAAIEPGTIPTPPQSIAAQAATIAVTEDQSVKSSAPAPTVPQNDVTPATDADAVPQNDAAPAVNPDPDAVPQKDAAPAVNAAGAGDQRASIELPDDCFKVYGAFPLDIAKMVSAPPPHNKSYVTRLLISLLWQDDAVDAASQDYHTAHVDWAECRSRHAQAKVSSLLHCPCQHVCGVCGRPLLNWRAEQLDGCQGARASAGGAVS